MLVTFLAKIALNQRLGAFILQCTGPSGDALRGDSSGGDQAPTTSLLDLGLSDSEPKVVPSDSDVLAILSSAHTSSNTVTSENLRHVQRVGHHVTGREKGRQRDKVAHSSKVGLRDNYCWIRKGY